MANGKKYYWMKLRKEFMEEAPISYLMGLDNGAGIVVLFIMLCMMCINSGGELAYKINKKMIPFNIAQIQGGCRYFSREAIEKGLKLFLELGLLYKKKNGVLAITGYEDFIGSETDYAIQKQRQRANRNKTADTARSDAPDPGEDAVGLLDVDMPADMRRESEGDNVGLSLSIPEEEFLNENKGKTARNDKNCPVDNQVDIQVDNGVDIDADKGWTSGWTMSTRDRERVRDRDRDRDKDKDRVIDNVNNKYKGIVKEDYKDISSLLYVTGKNSQNISYSSNSSCAELEKISSSTHAEISKDTSDKASSEPKAIIPLDDGSFYWVSPEEAACYQELFPDTDVDKALGDICRWFAAHPCGIRTDLRAFIISWMKSGAPGRSSLPEGAHTPSMDGGDHKPCDPVAFNSDLHTAGLPITGVVEDDADLQLEDDIPDIFCGYLTEPDSLDDPDISSAERAGVPDLVPCSAEEASTGSMQPTSSQGQPELGSDVQERGMAGTAENAGGPLSQEDARTARGTFHDPDDSRGDHPAILDAPAGDGLTTPAEYVPDLDLLLEQEDAPDGGPYHDGAAWDLSLAERDEPDSRTSGADVSAAGSSPSEEGAAGDSSAGQDDGDKPDTFRDPFACLVPPEGKISIQDILSGTAPSGYDGNMDPWNGALGFQGHNDTGERAAHPETGAGYMPGQDGQNDRAFSGDGSSTAASQGTTDLPAGSSSETSNLYAFPLNDGTTYQMSSDDRAYFQSLIKGSRKNLDRELGLIGKWFEKYHAHLESPSTIIGFISDWLCAGRRKDPDPVYQLPLNDGSFFAVYEEDLAYYRNLYQAVDVDAEFRKMIGWLDAKAKRRKTSRGIKAFITNWLARSQDSSGSKNGGGHSAYVNRTAQMLDEGYAMINNWTESMRAKGVQ